MEFIEKGHSLCQDEDSEDIAKNKNPLFLFQCNDVHEECSASLIGDLNSLLYIAYRMKYEALPWKKDETKVVIQKFIFSSKTLKLKKDENLEFLNVKMSSLKYHEKADFNCLMNRFKEEKKTNNECQTLCKMLLDIDIDRDLHMLAKLSLKSTFTKAAIKVNTNDFDQLVSFVGKDRKGTTSNVENK
uniref:Uncharacterized protein n=1 Tax=Strongyloides venezuelensis TaxID=75913 RepID=A0A0K0FGI1_STRVS